VDGDLTIDFPEKAVVVACDENIIAGVSIIHEY